MDSSSQKKALLLFGTTGQVRFSSDANLKADMDSSSQKKLCSYLAALAKYVFRWMQREIGSSRRQCKRGTLIFYLSPPQHCYLPYILFVVSSILLFPLEIFYLCCVFISGMPRGRLKFGNLLSASEQNNIKKQLKKQDTTNKHKTKNAKK